MSKTRWRVNPLHAMLRQWKSFEKRRGYRERMYCRTDVVKKAGQRQFRSSSSSADLIA